MSDVIHHFKDVIHRGHEGTPTSKARGHAEILGTMARWHANTDGTRARRKFGHAGTTARGHANIEGTRARRNFGHEGTTRLKGTQGTQGTRFNRLEMVIGPQPNLKKIADKRVDTPSFFIGDSVIDLVKKVKYLAVQLDSNLDWNQHMKVLCSKVSRAIGFLKLAKKFIPKESLTQMYRGIVEPYFRYCCSVWGSCGETRLRALQNCKIGLQGLSPIAVMIHLLPF